MPCLSAWRSALMYLFRVSVWYVRRKSPTPRASIPAVRKERQSQTGYAGRCHLGTGEPIRCLGYHFIRLSRSSLRDP